MTKKTEVSLPVNKDMATVFSSTRGMIHNDCPQRETTTTDYFVKLLGWPNDNLEKKRPRLIKKKLLFHSNITTSTRAESL